MDPTLLVNLSDINFQPFKYQPGLVDLWSMDKTCVGLTQLTNIQNSINLASILNL